MHEESRLEMQIIEMSNPQGFNQVSRKNGGQAWREAGPGSSEAVLTWKAPRTDT